MIRQGVRSLSSLWSGRLSMLTPCSTCFFRREFAVSSNQFQQFPGMITRPFANYQGVKEGPIRNVREFAPFLNEFIAYTDLVALQNALAHKSVVIASFALCGFANFGSVAIQIGGIGELAPSRRKDLAQLGIKALICGTFASYISACMAGILLG